MLVAVFTQAAQHNEPLAVSQPLMLIVYPVVNIVLAIWIFGEHFEGGWWQVTAGLVGCGVMASASSPYGPVAGGRLRQPFR